MKKKHAQAATTEDNIIPNALTLGSHCEWPIVGIGTIAGANLRSLIELTRRFASLSATQRPRHSFIVLVAHTHIAVGLLAFAIDSFPFLNH